LPGATPPASSSGLGFGFQEEQIGGLSLPPTLTGEHIWADRLQDSTNHDPAVV